VIGHVSPVTSLGWQVLAGQESSTVSTGGGGYSLSVVGSHGVIRQSLLLLALLAVCTAVIASSSDSSCRRLPLARVVVFIPPLFRLGQSVRRQLVSFPVSTNPPWCSG